MHSNLYEELRGKYDNQKSPTMTFIGGLLIGGVIGFLIGAVVMGQHVLNILS